MDSASTPEYDVIIIGGGATGAGIARDCTLRGLKAALVERFDIATGATGRNHGLLHSGARYAVTDSESARECIRENQILRRIARHCIEPTSGLFITLPDDDLGYQQTFINACTSAGFVVVEVRLVDDHRHRNAKMPAQIRHTLEIVPPRRRGFHHSHSQGGPGERTDHRATYARRAIAKDEAALFGCGDLARLLLEQAHQTARIFLTGFKLRVHKSAEARAAQIPGSTVPLGKFNGPGRAQLVAHAAALAVQRVYAEHAVLQMHGPELAKLHAAPALRAGGLVNDRRVARNKRLLLLYAGVKDDVQVGHVDIQITENGLHPLAVGQGSQGGAQRRLARAALAADDNYFTHAVPPLRPARRKAAPRGPVPLLPAVAQSPARAGRQSIAAAPVADVQNARAMPGH